MRFLPPFRQLALTYCFVLAAFAQSERGTITGTVRDSSGAVIPAAKVVLTNTQTGVSFTSPSNAGGEYTVPQLQVGTYTVRVEKEGFRPAIITGLVLNASATMRADATLEVGTATQAIEVSANALSLSTENAKTSVTINNKLVDELPLVVGGTLRSPFNLAALTPEAKNVGGDNGFILGGGQAAGYGTNLDGVSANTTRALTQSWVAVNAPSIEAITEFTVDTNGFKAEFGQATGGIMSFASKSGTNALHGTAYEFLRNNVLDAITSLTTPAASRARSTSSMTSASRSAGRSSFRKSTTARTRHSSSSATKPFAIAKERRARSAPCRRRKCTAATSATGLMRPAPGSRSTIPPRRPPARLA